MPPDDGLAGADQLGDLVRAARYDDDAFRQLVERFAGSVWAIARGFRLSRADAADISQVVWLRLATNLARIDEPEAVGAWIRTTAHRECVALLRRDRLVPVGAGLDDRADERVPPLDVGLVGDERHRALWEAFSSLSPQCQALLRLLLVDPPPRYDEIAELLAIPRGSIGPTRRRCIEKLQSHPAIARIREPAPGVPSAKAPR